MDYGLYDLVYYGNKFVNYQLEEVKLSHLVPKLYFASRFRKKMINETEFTLKNDFRTTLIGKEKDFTDFNNHSFIEKNGKIHYQYLGPFYNEQASDGSLTSTICEEVVKTENTLIDKCDTFMVYFDKKLSPGSITELTYASFKGKNIIIFYQIQEDVTYELQSDNWFPIVSSIMIAGKKNVTVVPVKDENDILSFFDKL